MDGRGSEEKKSKGGKKGKKGGCEWKSSSQLSWSGFLMSRTSLKSLEEYSSK